MKLFVAANTIGIYSRGSRMDSYRSGKAAVDN